MSTSMVSMKNIVDDQAKDRERRSALAATQIKIMSKYIKSQGLLSYINKKYFLKNIYGWFLKNKLLWVFEERKYVRGTKWGMD